MWYRKLPLTGSVSQRRRDAASRGSEKIRLRKKLAIRRPEQAFYREYSTVIALSGYRVKTTTRYQIAKLFNVAVPAILKWEKSGVLPEPIMYGQRGANRYPIFLSAQIRCLVMVVNDLVRDGGYLSVPWAYLPDHIAMLHQGYDEALLRFQKRAGYFDDEPLGDDERPDKNGVTFS